MLRDTLRLASGAALALTLCGTAGLLAFTALACALSLAMTSAFGVGAWPTLWTVRTCAAFGFLFGAGAALNDLHERWAGFKRHVLA